MLEFAKGLYYGSYANGLVVGVCNKLYKRDYIKTFHLRDGYMRTMIG